MLTDKNSDNIQVMVRVRPLNSRERTEDGKICISVDQYRPNCLGKQVAHARPIVNLTDGFREERRHRNDRDVRRQWIDVGLDRVGCRPCGLRPCRKRDSYGRNERGRCRTYQRGAQPFHSHPLPNTREQSLK